MAAIKSSSGSNSVSEAQTSSRGYAIYVLIILTLVNTFGFIDRQILSVLIVPIKAEFNVSDTWLGLLSGMAFVGVYVIMGFPLARWADRGSRRTVIAVSLALWSIATAVSGLAKSFFQLFIFRMGVGIGEAGASPSSHSLISDYFPVKHRATALAVYGIGVHLGIMFGFLAAGWVSQLFGWRMTFFVVGIPGLLLALLVHTTIREPKRDHVQEADSILDIAKYLFKKPAYTFLMIAASCHAFSAFGLAHWGPMYFSRVHGISLSSIGTWMGLISGGGGLIGALLGGLLADQMGAKNIRWWAYTAAIAALFSIPPGIAVLTADTARAALWFYLPYILLVALYPGALFVMVQGLAQPRMRATAVAIHLFLSNLIGGGIGPLVVGALNDYFLPEYDDQSIIYSLIIVIILGSSLAFLFYLATSKFLQGDLEPNM